jgi:acetyl-CoA acyltransferase
MNLGRIVAQKSGLPISVAGQTVNRFCASGLEAIAIACQKIMVGQMEVVVAGGVETMSTIPMGGNKLAPDPDLVRSMPHAYLGMGLTAENVAEKYGITRSDQDEFAFNSQQKAITALKEKRFESQIVPIKLSEGTFTNGKAVKKETVFTIDESVRFDISREGLAALKPIFRVKGTVTAGNSCTINDGAAAVVVMSRGKAVELGLMPMAVFRTHAVGGVEPELMGIGRWLQCQKR